MKHPREPPQPPRSPSRPFGIYIHIPFCLSKCHYCDFVSRPLAPGDLEPYLAALEREIAAAPEAGRRADTVYLGGGTPSLLDGGQLARLLGVMRRVFAVETGAEITIEANPGTLTPAAARDYRVLGVNRVSLGVQSLDDALLARLGRRHNGRESVASFELLRAAGFGNIGIDLIFGLPGQTPALWGRDLARAIALGPEHLSLYALGVEAGTPFAAEQRRGRLGLPAEEDEMAMLATAGALTAAAGFERYEIANYARPGRRCRHNADCWALGEYRGFGAGAHSFLLEPVPVRLANTAEIADYLRRLSAGEDPVEMREPSGPRRLAGEALMLGLRIGDGVDEAAFAGRHGARPAELFPAAAALGEQRGWLERCAGRLRLTDAGLLFSNEVFRLLF